MTSGPKEAGNKQERIDHDLPAGRGGPDDIGKHRHADALVVAAAAERQRPEMRRRPQEGDEEQRRSARPTTLFVAAAQPITGGSAPAAPPMTMLSGVERFKTMV